MWSGVRLTKRQVTSRPELWMKLGRNAKLKEKHKWAMEKQSSIMPEDHEEFILLTLRTRNSKKPLGILENVNTNGSRYALQDMQEEQEWRDPWQDE